MLVLGRGYPRSLLAHLGGTQLWRLIVHSCSAMLSLGRSPSSTFPAFGAYNNAAIHIKTACLAKRVARDHETCLGAPLNFNRKGKHQAEAEKQLWLPNMLFTWRKNRRIPRRTQVFMVFINATEQQKCIMFGWCGNVSLLALVSHCHCAHAELPRSLHHTLLTRLPPQPLEGQAAP